MPKRFPELVFSMKQESYHTSVLSDEVLAALNIIPGEVYFDGTLGGGGHTEKILEFGGSVVATDLDQDACDNAKKKFSLIEQNGVWVNQSGSLKIFKTNFQNLDEVLDSLGIKEVAGILFDLGVSSHMFDTSSRGFSFLKEGPLDMRMDKTLTVTAADLVNGLNEGELNELFTRLGQVSNARLLARAICQGRLKKRIETTGELKEIISRVTQRYQGEIDPATKVFMALRIAVNDELNNLKTVLPKAVNYLKIGGRLVVLSFHSLEDRIVKDFIRNSKSLKNLTDKPITPSDKELFENRRSRSVKMRAAERL